ncbi:hypothetical protein JI735_04395 [Paenibacillus sonchi]|uniref:Uncharacterized protein n=1 Tax=Paenibacillus sonchi TaxID=373687 RepID=A0A974SDY8_9BACL|nr:hypothetical protein [Paenibacillus sonchi]QQZ61944.1 hypothetical protein JI735_04395 [Paenibacillus sonchi]
MNVILLLLGLLSSYFSASPQQEPVAAAWLYPQPPVVQSFGHSVNTSSYIGSFNSLAGVSLYMPLEELLQVKGSPLEVTPDPWQGCQEYHYADMSAGICEGAVLYVHVTPTEARQYGLYLNDQRIEPHKNNLVEMLGTPDFVAEDGDVYMRGSTALKIYRNSQTGEWDGIDLFDGNSS